jgi:dipeptidyl aminopeptidase B
MFDIYLSFSYGGPGSQMTDLKFNRDWDHYVACGLQYIVVVVDGRGTGFKGRKLRNTVRNNLGYFETRDQINAAKSVGVPLEPESNLIT